MIKCKNILFDLILKKLETFLRKFNCVKRFYYIKKFQLDKKICIKKKLNKTYIINFKKIVNIKYNWAIRKKSFIKINKSGATYDSSYCHKINEMIFE